MGFAALPVVPALAAKKEKPAAQNTIYIQFEMDGRLGTKYELPRDMAEDAAIDIAYEAYKDGAQVSCRWVEDTLIATINKAAGG